MKYLTNEKLTIVGAGGMIGSNMAQTALMLGLTPNICLYDIFEPGVHGVAEEMYPKVCSMLDKLAKKNVIHKNKAGNLKSKLAKHVNNLGK